MRLTYVFIFVFFANISIGQIKIVSSNSDDKRQVEPLGYDSLKNYYNNRDLYLGQDLYLLPPNDRHIDINKRLFKKKVDDDKYHIADEVPAPGYYHVKNIVNNRHLELVDSVGNIYYYTFPDMEMYFNFITVGYYEKYVERLKGKKFYLYSDGGTVKDYFNKSDIQLSDKEMVICDDVVLDNELGFVFPIYKKGENIFRSGGHTFTIHVYDERSYLLGSAKYGKYWDAIARKTVKIGMTEEMVKESWGNPDRINYASYGDQWVYSGQYLYFENGVLKSYN